MKLGALIGVLFLFGFAAYSLVHHGKKYEDKQEMAKAMTDSMITRYSRDYKPDTVMVFDENLKSKVISTREKPKIDTSFTAADAQRLNDEIIKKPSGQPKISQDDPRKRESTKKPKLKNTTWDTLYNDLNFCKQVIKASAIGNRFEVDVELPYPSTNSYQPYDILIKHKGGLINDQEFWHFCIKCIGEITRKSNWKSRNLYMDAGLGLWYIKTEDCRNGIEYRLDLWLYDHVFPVHN